jgi:hypothetical protein
MSAPYPAAFEEVWAAYPGRPNNPKKLAFKAWRARLLEGITAAELLICAKEYANQLRRSGKLGTEFVMMSSTFFGPNERWRDFVPKPQIENTPRFVAQKQEERIDARPFIRELLENLAKGVRNV